VFGPLIDHGDVEAGLDEAGGDATAIGAGAEDRNFLRHACSYAASIARDDLIRAAANVRRNKKCSRRCVDEMAERLAHNSDAADGDTGVSAAILCNLQRPMGLDLQLPI
jgi:hypothetical protein